MSDVQFNIVNDMDKDESVTVYLTDPEKDALRQYADEMGSSMSDLAGAYIWKGLKRDYRLPEDYARPPGF